MRALGFGLLIAAAGLWALGCLNDFSIYDFSGQQPGGSAPTGGSGGASGGSGGSGGTGGGPTGGTGGTGECVAKWECPGLDDACKQRECVNHHCIWLNAGAGTDCQNGWYCDGQGNCVECLTDNDCLDHNCNNSNQCVPATCSDGALNGTETDVDCGGDTCPGCANGDDCLGAEDCLSRFCDDGSGGSGGAGGGGGGAAGAGGAGGAAPTCQPCGDDADCLGVTDAYCDTASSTCTDQQPLGAPCDAANECLSGFCPAQDGVCCDSECDQLCEGCQAAETGASDGTCAPISASTDPASECLDLGPQDCGADGTGCSGTAGACNLKDATTVCILACDATANEQTFALCDGAGTCNPGITTACDPYVCNAASSQCFTSCSSSNDCNADSYCSANACVAKLGNGSSCTTGEACVSTICVDGVCCDGSCGGLCESCLGGYTGGSNGQCLPVAAGTDPGNECPSGFCDGGNGCVSCSSEPAPPGGGCPAPCTSCAGGVCTVDCNADGSCQATTIDCPAGFQCIILCGGVSSCEGAVLNCPETYACDVTCNGPAGCRNASLSCSALGTCDLSCGPGSESCLGVAQTCGGNECRAFCDTVPVAEEPGTVCGSSCVCIEC